MLKLSVSIVAGLLCATTLANPAAAKDPGHVGFAAALNLEYGGDEVARIYFSDQSQQSVKAGQGIGVEVGAHYRPGESNLDFSAMVGLKYVGTKASNADINLTRTVFDALASYWIKDGVWVGAGPVWHTGIKFHGDGLGPNLNFDSALGFTAKIGYKAIALSYTGMNYKDEFGASYSASNIGLALIGRF